MEGSIGSFDWNPLDPNRQHYTVSISCRDGVFVEKWETTRVDGILRARLTIERGPQWVKKNPTLDNIVFRCTDPEFVETFQKPSVSDSRGYRPNHLNARLLRFLDK